MPDALVSSFARGNPLAMIRKLVDDESYVLSNAGAPISGTSGTFAGFAGPGSILLDTTNGKFYLNTNTKASPTWALELDTVDDGTPVRINSRSYTQTTGSSIGMQSKPSQTVTTTGDVIGAEFSPRYQDGIAGGGLVAVKADPILKGTTGNLSGNVVAFEANIDFGLSGTRTITGAVAAFRTFLAVPSGFTYTGKKSVILIANPNIAQWDYVFDIESSNTTLVEEGTNVTTVTLRFGSTDYRFRAFTDSQDGNTGNHFIINTESDNRTVKINSRNFTQTSGDSIGFQTKPSQTVSSSGSVQGGQISPRLQSGITLTGSIVGLHVDFDLKGTASGTIGGDCRVLELEMIADVGGGRTIDGDVTAIRVRSFMPASGGVSGVMSAMKIEAPEPGGVIYDALLHMPANVTGIWEDATASGSGSHVGFIKVIVDGTSLYIRLHAIS